MIEVTVRNYLKTKLDVPVYVGEMPATKPDAYVLIKTIESGRMNMIDVVTLDFYSYAQSTLKAAELNLDVKKAMFDIVSLNSVSGCKYGGGGQNYDTQFKQYYYDSIFNITYME